MSGICGVWTKGAELRGTLSAVVRGLSLAATERTSELCDGAAGVGASAAFRTQGTCSTERVMLACDADLHNETELRRLAGVASEIATPSVLAALYERFGCAFVERLEGGFSVVLWDRRERRLVAAIDRFGMRRLVYQDDSKGLLIASRIDALLESGMVSRDINAAAIPNLLNFSYNLSPGTIFRDVQRLAPGTLLIAGSARTDFRRYWDMRYGVEGPRDEQTLARGLEAVVEQAVAAHCIGEAPERTGAFLSGGTDSSTVVGMMTRMGRGPVRAFSIGFTEQQFNELEYAEITAKKFGAKHCTYLVGPDDCYKALPDMVRYFDEPFGNSSAIPTYFCARLAAQNGVDVLLAGDGGDELFAGNEWYRTEAVFDIYQKVPAVVRRALIEPALSAIPVRNGIFGKARRYVQKSNLPAIARLQSSQFLAVHAATDVFDNDFLAGLGSVSVADIPEAHYRNAPARDHLDRLLYLDLKTTIADGDLPKVTCMSELASVRSRFPLLDRSVAEYSGTIPAGLKVKGLEKRYLFKQAFRELLPPEVIRKKKHGFGIPVANWMKTDPRMRELARDTLLSRCAAERGYFRRGFIEELFRQHQNDDSSYYGDTLWTVLTMELWHHRMVDQPARVLA